MLSGVPARTLSVPTSGGELDDQGSRRFCKRGRPTEEIAEAIGHVLRAHGLEVDVKRMEDVDTVFPYDAFVLGSAVYVGGWLRSANRFLAEHEELISTRPTWLFSSGPIGDPPHAAAEESFDAVDLVDRTRAR